MTRELFKDMLWSCLGFMIIGSSPGLLTWQSPDILLTDNVQVYQRAPMTPPWPSGTFSSLTAAWRWVATFSCHMLLPCQQCCSPCKIERDYRANSYCPQTYCMHVSQGAMEDFRAVAEQCKPFTMAGVRLAKRNADGEPSAGLWDLSFR